MHTSNICEFRVNRSTVTKSILPDNPIIGLLSLHFH